MVTLQLKFNEWLDKAPALINYVRRPLVAIDSQGAQPILSAMSLKAHLPRGGCYRICYEPGTSGELMERKEGALKGTLTTTLVEGGRITGVAGLEKVDFDPSMMVSLMTTAAVFRIGRQISQQLDVLLNNVHEVREHQKSETYARFHGVTDSILSITKRIPNLKIADGQSKFHVRAGMVNECANAIESARNILYFHHRELCRLHQDTNNPAWSVYNEYDPWLRQDKGVNFCASDFLLKGILKHTAFDAFDRYVAALLCSLIVNDIFTPETISARKQEAEGMARLLKEIAFERLSRFEHWRVLDDFDKAIAEFQEAGDERAERHCRKQKEDHLAFIATVRSQIEEMLDRKLDSFDALEHLSGEHKLEIFVSDDGLLICEPQPIRKFQVEVRKKRTFVKREISTSASVLLAPPIGPQV